MNGSSIGLGNNGTVAICNYSSKIVNTEEAALTSYMKGKKQVKKVSFGPVYEIIDVTSACSTFDHIEN